MSPGTRNTVLRSSGLYQMRGSTATTDGRDGTRTQPAAERRRVAATAFDVAEHRRRGVGVVAVEDHLHLGRRAASQTSRRSPSGMTSTARTVRGRSEPSISPLVDRPSATRSKYVEWTNAATSARLSAD